MPPSSSITCKTVWLHANAPVSRPEVDLKVTTGISLFLIGLLWQRRTRGEREEKKKQQRQDKLISHIDWKEMNERWGTKKDFKYG